MTTARARLGRFAAPAIAAVATIAAFATVAIVVAIVAAPRPARAQPTPGEHAEHADKATIALLPFGADQHRLALYGQPVASEITRALREAGLDVTLVSPGAPVPSRARLVVSGRIVKSGAGVVLESRVRDPERGVDVARPSGSATSLDDIDQAAAALSAALVPAIKEGLVAQDDAAAREAAAADPTHAPPRPLPPSDPIAPRPAPPLDRRPLALVAVVAADRTDADGAAVPVAAIAAPVIVELAARVGHRALVITASEAASPSVLADRGAALLVTVELIQLRTGSSRDIPTARARARVTVTDGRGVIYRRIVRTDTLVGSRGDRVDTLVRFAAAQVTDVIAPRLRERLAKASAAP